ncbi:hypothetical protein DFJ74DRAFT_601042 [Hyaloraphidium curvatum]|nr:hypothetical protein DFJ74DRAFT_601042 [Hyaloraphidium curvatum]
MLPLRSLVRSPSLLRPRSSRGFLPDFLPKFPGAGPVHRFRDSKVLGYSSDQLFDLVRNVDEYRHFLPLTRSSRVISPARPCHAAGGEVLLAELAIGFSGFEESYVSRVRCWRPRRVEAEAADTSLFRTMKTIWTFEPATADGVPLPRTRVSFEITFAFNNPLHAAAASLVFGGVSKDVVTAFERRCLELYGAPAAM